MKKQHLYLLINLFINLNSYGIYHLNGSNPDSINDGPYIFYVDDKLKVTWIENGILREGQINPENFAKIKKNFNLSFNYRDLADAYFLSSNSRQSYKSIDSLSVISDIHGEYNTYITLLKAMGIIDQNLKWSFGKGHLVVLGDIFDRGNMVTEVLWHLFGLEKQAEKAGGMVHVLLGNHEVLILNKDLSYISEKYKKVEAISNSNYSDLYSENSVLGKWLRTKPAIISINNIIFVHGGIAMELVQRNLSIRRINQIFSSNIMGKEKESGEDYKVSDFLNDFNGPLWYRGYFTDANFQESRLDSILSFYHKEHIVVGHTTQKDVQSLFNNKIFGVDAGIMNDQPGMMLICKDGIFYKGSINGIRIKL
jgi:hypothetical protein